MPVPQTLFDTIYQAHGHRCPMSTLGGRMGYAARRHFAEAEEGNLLALYRARTCAVDGIRLAAGGLKDGETFFVVDEGEHRLLMVDRTRGIGVHVSLRAETLERAADYRRHCTDIDRRLASSPEGEKASLLGEREGALDALLQTLRTLPDDELLEIRTAPVDVASLLAGVVRSA